MILWKRINMSMLLFLADAPYSLYSHCNRNVPGKYGEDKYEGPGIYPPQHFISSCANDNDMNMCNSTITDGAGLGGVGCVFIVSLKLN